MSVQASPSVARRLRGLRTNSFAATVMLVVEFGLGVWVNLYASLPAADQGANITTGFARAIANGPLALSIHAIVGALLIISATTAVVRAVLVKRRVLTAITSIGLLAVVFAALSGARFIGDSASGTSMSMATGAAVAMICYALVLFITPSDAPAEVVSYGSAISRSHGHRRAVDEAGRADESRGVQAGHDRDQAQHHSGSSATGFPS